MFLIILIGAIYMLVDGGLFQCLLFIGLALMVSDKFTDSNRRGKWW